MMEFLLLRDDIEVNKKDSDGEFPLMLAYRFRLLAPLKTLLDHPDIDVNSADPDGLTVLHQASSQVKLTPT